MLFIKFLYIHLSSPEFLQQEDQNRPKHVSRYALEGCLIYICNVGGGGKIE